MDVRVGSSSSTVTPEVSRGAGLPSLSFLVHNYADRDFAAADFSGGLSWTVWLSTNDTLSVADEQLRASVRSGVVIDAMDSLRITTTGTMPVIPTDFPPGIAYVGIILTTTDADSGNQKTLAADMARIKVNERMASEPRLIEAAAAAGGTSRPAAGRAPWRALRG
jgi:hypothetical protein